MGVKSDVREHSTQRTVYELGRALQVAAQDAGAQSVDQVESGSGALSAFDDRADIQVVIQGKSLLGGFWAVQVYVVDNDSDRTVTLVALGDTAFTRAMSGARYSTSLAASIKKRDGIAVSLV